MHDSQRTAGVGYFFINRKKAESLNIKEIN